MRIPFVTLFLFLLACSSRSDVDNSIPERILSEDVKLSLGQAMDVAPFGPSDTRSAKEGMELKKPLKSDPNPEDLCDSTRNPSPIDATVRQTGAYALFPNSLRRRCRGAH